MPLDSPLDDVFGMDSPFGEEEESVSYVEDNYVEDDYVE